MGTEFYLLCEQKQEKFDLGKDLVNEAFYQYEKDADVLPNRIVLTYQIACSLQSVRVRMLRYAAWLAREVSSWAGKNPVEFVDEHDRRLEDPRLWPTTGSRYK